MRFVRSASALLKDYSRLNGRVSEFRHLFRDVAGRNVRIFKFTIFSIDMDALRATIHGCRACRGIIPNSGLND
jgi:hypothetical protein